MNGVGDMLVSFCMYQNGILVQVKVWFCQRYFSSYATSNFAQDLSQLHDFPFQKANYCVLISWRRRIILIQKSLIYGSG